MIDFLLGFFLGMFVVLVAWFFRELKQVEKAIETLQELSKTKRKKEGSER